jgi:ABC-type uncharacterized transport system permease subunit
MDRYWLAAAAFCFLLSFGHTLFALGAGKFRPARFNLVAMASGFLFLTVFLYLRGQVVGACPITNLFEVLVFLSWSIVLIYLLVGPAYRLSLMGAFTSPLVLALLLFALLATDSTAPVARTSPNNPWVEFHAALSIIAYGAFGLAAISGIMYLVQERQLKSQKASELLYNLPPITDLGVANARLVFTGFALLTISFAAGFVAGLHVASLKFWTSAAIWTLYGLMLLLRRTHLLAPHRAAGLSIGVFAIALVTLPAIQYLSAITKP